MFSLYTHLFFLFIWLAFLNFIFHSCFAAAVNAAVNVDVTDAFITTSILFFTLSKNAARFFVMAVEKNTVQMVVQINFTRISELGNTWNFFLVSNQKIAWRFSMAIMTLGRSSRQFCLTVYYYVFDVFVVQFHHAL